MASGTQEDLTFSPDSVEFRDLIEDRIMERLRDLAVAKVRAEGRTNVTQEDFLACIKEAAEQVVREALEESSAPK